MGGLKEIRRRITSVKNTKQITRAMKLVSAAKLRRAQDAATGGRRYSETLGELVSELSTHLPEGFSHPLLQVSPEVKTRLAIVYSGERGLCGAYNTNVLKAVAANENDSSVETKFIAIGRRTISAGKRLGWNVIEGYEGLPETIEDWPVEEIVSKALKPFSEGEIDEVVIYYTKFVTAMTQMVEREVLFPLSAANEDAAESTDSAVGQLRFDPTAQEIFIQLLPLMAETKIRQAALESKASEHASRMAAMDSATRNADELIDKLKLYYNRARQSAITTELIDIVGGAEAIS